MLYVSILAELIRSRPALAVWAAALLQALLWALVPTLVYWGPPGDVPFVLAAGHEFQFGGFLNPPLAYWLADIAFRITGGSLFGVYALSQACVVATYWAVFALGRSIVGEQHAALAVLLTAAISVFSVPTPDFGPMVLTMPLWAFTLLHYWRAIGEGRREYWIALAVDAGLLLLTSYLGILLLAILAGFTVANQRVRLVLASYEPWAAALAASLCLVPHLWWLRHSGLTLPSVLAGADGPVSIAGHILGGFRLFAGILIAHVGLLALVAIVSGWPRTRHDPGPVIVRPPVKPFARQFVYVFALAPAAAATALTFIIGSPGPLTGIAPLVVLSGLAAIILAGDAIELAHQRRLIFGWFAVLLISSGHGDRGVPGPAMARHRHDSDAAGQSHGAVLRRQFPAPRRRAAVDRHRRSAHRRHGQPGAQPPASLPGRHATAIALGHRGRREDQGRHRGSAELRYRGRATAGHRGALPRLGPGSAAHLRASGAGRAPAAADRLGADPAAIGPGRSESGREEAG